MNQRNHDAPVLPLYPQPGSPQALCGLYRDMDLPEQGRWGPWVYGNFVTTLDGRIALADPDTGTLGVTASIGDDRDWRLFQELAARADILVSNGRYLRDLRLGKAQDVLPLSSAPAYEDLHTWRRDQGMAPQPDVAVLSTTLDFQIPDALFRQGRRVLVLTTTQAPDSERARHEADGAEVIATNDGSGVNGGDAAAALGTRGYGRAYVITGPEVMHALVAAGALDALFLTQRHRLVAGSPYRTIMEGQTLTPPADWRLESLYLDTATDRAEQQFARFTLESPRA